MLLAVGPGGVALMVSKQAPMTIGHGLSLAFHTVTPECIHDDVIMPVLYANVSFM